MLPCQLGALADRPWQGCEFPASHPTSWPWRDPEGSCRGVSVKQKETTAHSPWELPATPKRRARGCCSHRWEYLESVPSIPTLGSTQSGSLCGLCLWHQGWQEEGTAGETEFGEINPFSSLALGVLQAQAQREGCREGAEVTSRGQQAAQ